MATLPNLDKDIESKDAMLITWGYFGGCVVKLVRQLFACAGNFILLSFCLSTKFLVNLENRRLAITDLRH
jgi:hypothetical protein